MTLPTASIGGTDTQLTLDNSASSRSSGALRRRDGDGLRLQPHPPSTPPAAPADITWSDWQYPDDFDCAAGGTRTRYRLPCGEIETESNGRHAYADEHTRLPRAAKTATAASRRIGSARSAAGSSGMPRLPGGRQSERPADQRGAQPRQGLPCGLRTSISTITIWNARKLTAV